MSTITPDTTYTELVAQRDGTKAAATSVCAARVAETRERFCAERDAVHTRADAEFGNRVRGLYRAQMQELHAEAVPILSRLLAGNGKLADAAILAGLIRSFRDAYPARWGRELPDSQMAGARLCADLIEAAMLAADPELIDAFGCPDARSFAAGPSLQRMLAANAFYQVCIGVGAKKPDEVLYAFDALRTAAKRSTEQVMGHCADARERWEELCFGLPPWLA
jgi:hypothetical protein